VLEHADPVTEALASMKFDTYATVYFTASLCGSETGRLMIAKHAATGLRQCSECEVDEVTMLHARETLLRCT
jgi:hypothetical protein